MYLFFNLTLIALAFYFSSSEAFGDKKITKFFNRLFVSFLILTVLSLILKIFFKVSQI